MANLADQSDALVILWQRQGLWSEAANRLKVGIGRARAAALALTIVGAALGTASSQAMARDTAVGRGLAVAAAVALAIATLARRGAAGQTVRDWTRARSVAESIKADV